MMDLPWPAVVLSKPRGIKMAISISARRPGRVAHILTGMAIRGPRAKIASRLQAFSRAHSDLFAHLWQRTQTDDLFDLAAQISYFFSLSLLPFCLVLAVFVGWLPSTFLWNSFASWIVTYLPRESQHLIFSTILGLDHYSTGFLSLGLITAVWSASSGFVSLMESLSIVNQGRDSRSFWRKRAIAVCVTLLTMVFALGCFGLVALGHWSSGWFGGALVRTTALRFAWHMARWITTLIVMGFAVDLANCFLPDGVCRWRWITPGTAFDVLTLVASSAAFNLYFQHFSSYPRIYGALGGFIIFMLWIYVASLILLIGAEIDREIATVAMGTRPG
jgi:membrane protein